uniref:Uncharacterized protein n=1 Tax=Rhipicephalus appendiculatus TaxID=34631 RepID=A0A131YDT8_RHIAP
MRRYMQGRFIRDKIRRRCKERLKIFICSCTCSSGAGSVYSALALMPLLCFNILFSVLLGVIGAAATRRASCPEIRLYILSPALRRTPGSSVIRRLSR